MLVIAANYAFTCAGGKRQSKTSYMHSLRATRSTPLSCRCALQVNKYPHRRTFKAIGEGGDNFKSCMQAAVEDVLGPVGPDRISHRLSSGKGSYISVSIGPVTVQNSQQVSDMSFTGQQSVDQLIHAWHHRDQS